MRRRALVATAIASALAVVRCSAYSSHDDLVPPPEDGGADVNPDVDLDVAAFVPIDAGGDVASRDGAVDRDAACPDLCDCDGDLFKNATCENELAKVDCDDGDPLVHPKQGFVSSKWDATSPHQPPGDWDCDGVVTRQFATGVNCGTLGLGAPCAGVEGFTSSPACGEPATYTFCKTVTLACTTDHSETRTQTCR